MIVTFLGTGTSQGVPVIGCDCEVCKSPDQKDKRLRTSVHVFHQGKSIVIDTGPDFRQQMLRENVLELDAVLLTHQHKDHIAGLDDIRSYNFRLRKKIPVYANRATINQLKNEFPYVFTPEGYGGAPRIEIYEIKNSSFKIDGVEVIPVQVLHHNLPVFGFRIGDFTYITDANFIPESEIGKIYGSKVLVLNALQKKPHISHFSLTDALDQIKRLKPGKAYLTHLSHRMGLHAEVSKELPENVFLAYDGLKLTI